MIETTNGKKINTDTSINLIHYHCIEKLLKLNWLTFINV